MSSWLIRPARNTKADRVRLERFSCCAQPDNAWQAEVEHSVRTTAFDWAFDPFAKANDPRLLLVFEGKTKTLIAVAAHERTTLGNADFSFAATKLQVIAIDTGWQGRKFETGERVSDVVMSAAITDVARRVPARHARIYALVHEDNHRIAVCQRHGFTMR